MKVVELIVEKMAYGWSPEELHLQHTHLTLGQIYSAPAYYFDHQPELDRDIEKHLERVGRAYWHYRRLEKLTCNGYSDIVNHTFKKA